MGSAQAAAMLSLAWKSQSLQGLGRLLPKLTAHPGKALAKSSPRLPQPVRESGADLPFRNLPELLSRGHRNWGTRKGRSESCGPTPVCANEETKAHDPTRKPGIRKRTGAGSSAPSAVL